MAHYVRPQSALDREARNRGNSTYFPDRVVPMLPDVLSGNLCSLHEAVDRAVIAVEMRITAEGQKIGHRFVRGMMRSRGSLAYEEVQAAIDGTPNDRTEPLLPILRTLFDAYAALVRAREARQPLDIDLPERRIVLSDDGKVVSVAFKERLDAHRLIEEFMVLANVAAAETLIAKRTPSSSASTRSRTRKSSNPCAKSPRARASRWPRDRCSRPGTSTASSRRPRARTMTNSSTWPRSGQ